VSVENHDAHRVQDERLPRFEPNDITQILLILLRIEAKLDALLEEEDGEEEDDA
jgi:hypothetical protein